MRAEVLNGDCKRRNNISESAQAAKKKKILHVTGSKNRKDFKLLR